MDAFHPKLVQLHPSPAVGAIKDIPPTKIHGGCITAMLAGLESANAHMQLPALCLQDPAQAGNSSNFREVAGCLQPGRLQDSRHGLCLSIAFLCFLEEIVFKQAPCPSMHGIHLHWVLQVQPPLQPAAALKCC